MLPEPAPIPIAATFDIPTRVYSVTFDRALTANPALNLANWSLCAVGNTRTMDTAASAGAVVSGVVSVFLGGACGGPSISYAAAPADVLGVTGTPVAAFAGFPLTVTP